MRFFYFSTVFSILALCSSCSNFSKVLKSRDNAYKLEQADKYYANKEYRNAQTLYEELYPIYKGTDKFEELYYKDAYCFFYMKEYQQAEDFFKGFTEVFPNSPKADDADYMRAYCVYKRSPKVELDQTNTIKAMGMMQTFINRHPGSAKIAEATSIIDECRIKLEMKAYNAAKLYYKVGQYKAAAMAYEALMNDYPSSAKGEEYNLELVRSYYEYAVLSIPEKQLERFQKVVNVYQDFADRYSDSKLLKEAEHYENLSQNNIKAINNNEQAKTSIER